MHGPTPEERKLMGEWIGILVAFVQGEEGYEFGTKGIEEMMVAGPEGRIEVKRDRRWESLTGLGGVFAKGEV